MSVSFEENNYAHYFHNANNANNSIICAKHDIVLSKTSHENEYFLKFKIYNKNINVYKFLDWNIYDLLYSLNRDILDDMKITTEDNNTKTFSYLFKRFGKELGILQRYLIFNIKKIILDDKNILYICRPPTTGNNSYINAEPVSSNFAKFNIRVEDNHTMFISYHYHIDLVEQLPKSMENIAGILIKKLFWRFKTFIENID